MNVMFIHVPKTAGTAIEKSFEFIRVRSAGKFDTYFKNKGQYSFGHLDVRKRLANGAISKKFYRSAFKFCFCRNPYDRAVSHYHYARKRHPKDFSPEVSFMDFTRTLGDYGRMFRTQKYYVDGIHFDFIGRYETLDQDFQHVAKIIGKNAELMTMNTTRHKPFIEYYNEESAANIAAFYKEDFERFEYDNRLLPVF